MMSLARSLRFNTELERSDVLTSHCPAVAYMVAGSINLPCMTYTDGRRARMASHQRCTKNPNLARPRGQVHVTPLETTLELFCTDPSRWPALTTFPMDSGKVGTLNFTLWSVRTRLAQRFCPGYEMIS